MAADAVAYRVQGPDGGGGNPVPVALTTSTGVSDVNVAQVAGVAVATAAAGIEKVGIVSGNNGGQLDFITVETLRVVGVCNNGSAFTNQTGAANTAVTQTYGAVAGQKHHLTHCSLTFTGANTAGQLTVADGGTTVMTWNYGASQNTTLNVPLPEGGITGTTNTAMTITLPAGGAAVTGTLTTGKRTF